MDLDRHQRVGGGIIMIESGGKSLAGGHRQIQFECVGGAARRIGPRGVVDHRTDVTVAEVDRGLPLRLHARRAIQQSRQLAERDRPDIIETAGRLPRTQQPRDRRKRLRRRT